VTLQRNAAEQSSMGRTVRTVTVAIIVCALTSLGRAQEVSSSTAMPAARRPLFRSAVELVALNVTVLDEHKRFLGGLGPQDFVVYENGIQQELAFFGLADVPVDLVLLLDLSASMGTRLDVVQEAAIGFVRRLRPGDRALLVGFATGARMLQSLSDDVGQLERAIRQTRAGGSTALYDALYAVLGELRRERQASSEIRRQVAVVLSDGVDTASLTGGEDVVAAARRSGAMIYTVALKDAWATSHDRFADRRTAEADFTLKALALDSGGLTFSVKDAKELGGIYEKVATEMAHQYVLAYVPPNAGSNVAFRSVSVRLASKVRAEVRTRRGYSIAER
jgi:Ca-activated chloride channel homolog